MLRLERTSEFRTCDVIRVPIAGEVELFRHWPHMPTKLQIAQHSVRHVVVLLRVTASADFLLKEL